MSQNHLSEEELSRLIIGIVQRRRLVGYDELLEVDELSNISEWRIEIAIRRLLYNEELVETDSGYRVD